MINKELMYEITNIETKFDEIVLDYFMNMSSDMTVNEVVDNQDDFYAGATDLVYTYKCIAIFEKYFMDILEIIQEYEVMTCSMVSHEVDEMVQVAFDWIITRYIRDMEYYVEYEMEDEDDDISDEDFNQYMVYPTN